MKHRFLTETEVLKETTITSKLYYVELKRAKDLQIGVGTVRHGPVARHISQWYTNIDTPKGMSMQRQ